MRVIKTVLVTIFFFFIASSVQVILCQSFNVFSFNIRYDNPGDGINQWKNRKEKVAELISYYDADIIGMQEALKHQIDDLERTLTSYEWIGVGRDDGKEAGEYSPVFYRADRFELLESNTFWLSETCDEAGSQGWDAACKRVVSWGKFREKEKGTIFYCFNTHFDHRGQVARRESSRLLLEKVEEIAGRSKAIVTGDFNSTPDSEPYNILTEKGNSNRFSDSRLISQNPHYGPEGTFNGFKNYEQDDNNRIDYVFVKNDVQIINHAILSDSWGGLFPSDHFPVLAKVSLTDRMQSKVDVDEKRRVLVLTDIDNEPDDAMSLVRFLSYANQWDVEGLVATTSFWKKTSIADWRIYDILEAYEKVQPNLLKHEKGFPTSQALKNKVKKGLPEYGMSGVGKGKDSEGSEWIIKVLEEQDDRSVWILAWGGTNCLAQALWKIKHTKTPAEATKLYEKVHVYAISDQDDSGPWIRKTFPDIFYICSPGYEHDGAGGYHYATWSGISGDVFHGRFHGANREVISEEWLNENIQTAHGPLGSEYPDVKYLMEGDSPSFMYLIPNGLSDPEHPNRGSWGGRYEYYTPPTQKWYFEPESRPFWTNAMDEFFSPIDSQYHTSHHVTIWRWREAYQNDFAARMDWSVKEFEEANHHPVPNIAHEQTLKVYSENNVFLDASLSTDPDGDELSYNWFHYRGPGTFKGKIKIKNAESTKANFKAPIVSTPRTAHFILQVTDSGEPALTRYKRVIVNILPKS
ncbi:MAG: DUF1593 domain-containing protein [Bacteroidetes bacterium]|nr:DUF1593 domain-containing protein [Bacteroidota bacterium]